MIKYNTRRSALAMIVLAGLLATNCQQQPKTDIETISFPFDQTENALDIKTIADTVYDPIVLETTDESLIGSQITKIAFAHDTIIIVDRESNSVFFFDGNGKYLSKIQRAGRGPEEYVKMSSVFICNNRVLVMDYEQPKLCCYDFSGKHLYHFDTKEINIVDIAEQDGRIFCATAWWKGNEWNNSLMAEFDLSGNMVRTHYHLNDDNRGGYVHSNFFIKTKDGLDVHLVSKNLVYTLKGDEFVPSYKVDFGENELPEDAAKQRIWEIFENKYLDNYTLGVQNLIEAGRFRLVNADFKNESYMLVYDKQKHQVVNTYNHCFLLDGAKLEFYQYYADGDYFALYLNNEQLEKLKTTESAEGAYKKIL